MNSIKNILVPIDFSEESIIGLDAAIQLAERFDCVIHTAHFVLPDANVSPKHPKEEVLGITNTLRQKQLSNVRQESYDKLSELTEKYIPRIYRGHACIIGGKMEATLEEFVKSSDFDIDLIVVGDFESRGILDLLTWSNTDTLIKNADLPVLAVSEEQDLTFENVLVATDLSMQLPDKIQKFCQSLSRTGSMIHFLNVITIDTIAKQDVEKRIDALAETFELNTYKVHVKENASEIDGVKATIEEIKADLLLMKTHEKSDFMAFVGTSLAKKVIRQTDVPVLVEKIGSGWS